MSHSVAYPKIVALGGPGIGSIFDEDVEITEKLDGSQFGFGLVKGELVCRSKGKEQDIDNPDKMFKEGVEYIQSVQHLLPEGLFFYGEYLQKPRQSTLAYNNTPKNHIALFGVMDSSMDSTTMHDYSYVRSWAKTLGIDPMPLLYQGKSNPQHVLELMETNSYLGGQQIEGVVVKNYKPWLFMNQILYPVMAGKYVSEKFKEVHSRDWGKLNTGRGKLEAVNDKYRSEARWHKAAMHMKEDGRLTDSLKDIGELIKEVQKDLVAEELPSMMQDLWKILGPDIVRHSTAGLPQWWKEQLLSSYDKPEGETDGSETRSSDISSDASLPEA